MMNVGGEQFEKGLSLLVSQELLGQQLNISIKDSVHFKEDGYLKIFKSPDLTSFIS